MVKVRILLAVAASGLHAEPVLNEAARAVTYVLWDAPDLDDWNEVPAEDPIIGDGLAGEFLFPRPGDPGRYYRLDHDYAAPE